MKDPMVMVALDKDLFHYAEVLAKSSHNIGFKLNLDYLLKVGIKQAGRLKDFGRPLFADVKMWNGLRTMMGVMEQLWDAGFSYTNVHILAGSSQIPRMNFTCPFKLLGIALLTHYDEDYGYQFFDQDTSHQITKLINIGNFMALDGIICGPGHVSLVGKNKLRVCPGIRPTWYEDKRHAQSFTPAQAVQAGVDIMVIGSPITKSLEPLQALERIFEEIKQDRQEVIEMKL